MLRTAVRRLAAAAAARLLRRAAHSDALGAALARTLETIHAEGTFKKERMIASPQSASIRVRRTDGSEREAINFCSNNYLGLADEPSLIAAAKDELDRRGLGLASVRFICGTQDIHKELEASISLFHKTQDTILYSSCFDANAGLFETILGEEDAILSDELNHASIIDGIRLCKAKRYRFKHMDMDDLEAKLKESQSQRARLISTDGVFSMDGDIAPLKDIFFLAEKYNAVVHVDECHASGLFGPTGRGTVEHFGLTGKIGVITSTLGKALGGASGGFTTGREDVIEVLRQRSRPYLFSNTIAPPVVGASLRVFELLTRSSELVVRLQNNTAHFRRRLTEAGFDIRPNQHPIVPVMLGDARLASEFADELFERGVFVVGFSYPVVPKGKARIRCQVTAAHTIEQLDRTVDAFIEVGRKKGVINA